MPKVVVQPRVTVTVQKEVAEYYCDACGRRCGTRANPKSTWWSRQGNFYYCMRTCKPGSGKEDS